MHEVKPGDYVGRKSYGCDIVFRVKEVYENEQGVESARIVAMDVRLLAHAPVEDLEVLGADRVEAAVREIEERVRPQLVRSLQVRAQMRLAREPGGHESGAAAGGEGFREIPGRVLHLDGDPNYLEQCLHYYRELGMSVTGLHVSEAEQPNQVVDLLKKHRPDVLVLTGHDGLPKGAESAYDLDKYYSSRFFVEAVERARDLRPEKDGLVIFAGACQSYYEAIIAAGANYASSPQRKLIHCYDPVFVAEKISFTPIGKVAAINEVIAATITGVGGVGGIETMGRFRLSLPETEEAPAPAPAPAEKVEGA